VLLRALRGNKMTYRRVGIWICGTSLVLVLLVTLWWDHTFNESYYNASYNSTESKAPFACLFAQPQRCRVKAISTAAASGVPIPYDPIWFWLTSHSLLAGVFVVLAPSDIRRRWRLLKLCKHLIFVLFIGVLIGRWLFPSRLYVTIFGAPVIYIIPLGIWEYFTRRRVQKQNPPPQESSSFPAGTSH
jgi:hypothetical protein